MRGVDIRGGRTDLDMNGFGMHRLKGFAIGGRLTLQCAGACIREQHSENKKTLLPHMPFLHSQMTGEVEIGAYFVTLEVYRGTREVQHHPIGY